MFYSLTIYAGVNDKGIEYYSAGMLETARIYFIQHSGDAPADKAEACYYLGLIYEKQGLKDSVDYYFQKAFDIVPPTPYGYICKGKLELERGTSKEILKAAEDKFKKAQNLAKKDASIPVKVAEAYYAKGLNIQALEAIEKAKKINIDYSGIYMLEGEQFLKENNLGNAMSRFEMALMSNDKDKISYLKLAQVYININRKDLSLDYLNKVLKIDPSFVPAYVLSGDIKNEQGRYKEAISDYEKAIAVPGAPLEVYEHYAQSLYFDKQYDKSISQIQYVLSKDPNNAVMHRLEAYNDYELGNFEGGLQKMEQFLSSVSKDRHIYLDYLTMAQYYEQMKQYGKAIEYYQSAIALDETKTDLYKNMASASIGDKKFIDAIGYFEKYFEINPNYLAMDLYSYSDACLNASAEYLSKYDANAVPEQAEANEVAFNLYADKVIKANTELVEKAPDSYLGYYGRAKAYSLKDAYQQKKTEKLAGYAKPYYEEALVYLQKNNEEGRMNRYILEAYNYLFLCALSAEDKAATIDYSKKILEYDPQNENAKQALDFYKVKY
jgi:tetratricopeptide (TPR) repeat protein